MVVYNDLMVTFMGLCLTLLARPPIVCVVATLVYT